MTTLPVRDIAALGVIYDDAAHDLPPPAWSHARNVRFGQGRIERAPHFLRDPAQDAFTGSPVHIAALPDAAVSGGQDSIFVFHADGKAQRFLGEAASDVSPVGPTLAAPTAAATSTVANGLLYYHRPDTVPHHYDPASARFVALPAWDAGWRCGAFRAFGDYLLAINLTKGGQTLPATVKWSTETSWRTPPASWDHTDPTLNAGEQTLPWARTGLVDGQEMDGTFYLYSEDAITRVRPTGSTSIFRWEPFILSGFGALAPNCIATVGRRQFVFGPSDIYVHDGLEPKSIAAGRVRRHIFSRLDYSRKHVCHVLHYPEAGEVWFCYVSNASDVRHPGTAACNEAAVFNYTTGAWSFVDLPNVVGAARANYFTAQTWDSLPETVTWSNISGTWASVDADPRRFALFVSAGVGGASATIYPCAVSEVAPSLPLQVADEAIADAVLERRGIDLDEMGAPLAYYWGLRCIHPQLTPSTGHVTLQAGGHMETDDEPRWSPVLDVTPGLSGRVDCLSDGRYVALRLTATGPDSDFTFTGYDLDVVNLGRR